MSDNNSQLVVSYLTLRQMIGWLGLLMPIAVRLGAYLFEGIHTTESISAYYYTGMRDVFVSTLILVGTLLTCYRSPAWSDGIVAIIAGLAAIGIGLFPADPQFAAEILRRYPEMSGAGCYVSRGILGYHSLFVVIFALLSFYLVYFRFNAFTPASPTKEKQKRNRIYKICGMTMLISFVIIGALVILNNGTSIFWPEAVAVISFAAAWLVKGQTILKDGPT
jgi:uncharacterized membrane protein YidH (DUF202 family)